MPDVLKIAKERRAALLKEVSALDRFIETANALLASVSNEKAEATGKPRLHEPLKPTPVAPRTSSSAPPNSETEAFLRARGAKVQNDGATSGSEITKASKSALG